jgi:hypothetical protein
MRDGSDGAPVVGDGFEVGGGGLGFFGFLGFWFGCLRLLGCFGFGFRLGRFFGAVEEAVEGCGAFQGGED